MEVLDKGLPKVACCTPCCNGHNCDYAVVASEQKIVVSDGQDHLEEVSWRHLHAVADILPTEEGKGGPMARLVSVLERRGMVGSHWSEMAAHTGLGH
jgi:hypothetical protein